MRQIDTIVVHCSATKPSMQVDASIIRQWHLARGWKDIGYHYVITRTGMLETGRDESVVGAHTLGYNKTSIGICMVGGLNEDGKPDSNFTYAQYTTLVQLITDLQSRYNIEKVMGHREAANKACPCFDIKSLLEYYT